MDRDSPEAPGEYEAPGERISIGKVYEEFAHQYGWAREYIQGRWINGRLKGLTRPLLKLYWRYLQERKVEEIKQQIRMLGGKVEDEKTLKGKKELAERKARDPLADFPNDIEYLTKPQCKEKEGISQRFGKKWPKEKLWDGYRTQACLGKLGLVARRASMNDTLWGMWMKAIDLGKSLSLDDLKKRIKFDYARSKLYPPDYTGDGSEPPPQEYLEKLRARGELAKIYAEMEAC